MGTQPLPSAEALALLDTAACGLLRTDGQGIILRANRTFCEWVGRTAEELIGKVHFQALLTVGGRMFHQTHWAPLLQMQGSLAEVKLELLHRDGTAIPMVLNARRTEDAGVIVHELAAFVAWDRDKYEKELVRSRKRLEELVAESKLYQETLEDRALFAEQMMGIVSHDLRNPISAIIMGAAMLERGELTSSQQRNVSRIVRSGEMARYLISDLLDFTVARVGKGLSVEIAAADFHQLVQHCTDELILLYPGRLLTHHRSGEGAFRGDRNRIDQLVGNLVSNAMTYGRDDAEVRVTSALEGNVASIEVHNLGPPIPLELQATIFQPMTRGKVTPSATRSVGLGLFIVQEIAKAHGGKVSVTSSAEQGTMFRASFPRG